MSLFLYNFFLWVYRCSISVAAIFQPKARKWVDGRKQWEQSLTEAMERLGDKPRFWIHCASLGEFEQGRPIIESYRKAFPNHAIILSFFSPSGFEVRKNYAGADHVVYMPMDGKGAAKRFIQLVNPIRVVFVKYEYWYYYLHTLRKMGIPTILVSAAFRPDQVFFRWYGKFFQDILSYFTQIFVQDERSAQLLEGIGLKDRVSIAGDTRYDRVVDIASKAPSFPLIEAFKGNSALVIAGSTWPADENILHEVWRGFPNGWKLVIAPHEIDAAHIRELQRQFTHHFVLYSELEQGIGDYDKEVLLIDNIGMLSALYQYGEIAYVGGGFQSGGIHNILEPAVFGLPVVIGTNWEKFVEAREMVHHHFAFPINNTPEAKETFYELFSHSERLSIKQSELRSYILSKTGATTTIMKFFGADSR